MAGAILLSGFMVMVNSSEGASESGNGTSESPYTKTVSIPSGGTKVVYISLNLTAFDFVKKGDGYYIEYGIGHIKSQVDGRLTENGGQLPAWSNDSAVTSETLSVKPIKVDDTGTFGLVLILNSSCTGDCSVDLSFNVISYSVSQTIYYKFNIIEEATTTYSLSFSDVVIDSDGLFSTKGTLKVGGNSVDLSNYRFYAVGLYPGIAIHNDLSITGRADMDDEKWNGGNSMSFKVAITDVSSKSTVVVDSVIKYSISASVSSLSFTITSGDSKMLDNNSGVNEISVRSGTPLILNVQSGTEATVVYADEQSQVSTKTIYSTASVSGKQILNTSGNGTYSIVLSKSGTADTRTITINVVGSLTAINSIRVTCGPL